MNYLMPFFYKYIYEYIDVYVFEFFRYLYV